MICEVAYWLASLELFAALRATVDGGTREPLARGNGLRGVGAALLPDTESADEGLEYVRLEGPGEDT